MKAFRNERILESSDGVKLWKTCTLRRISTLLRGSLLFFVDDQDPRHQPSSIIGESHVWVKTTLLLLFCFLFFLVNLVPKVFYLFLIWRLAKWNIVIKLLAFHNKNGLHFRNQRNNIPLVSFLLWRYSRLLKFKTKKTWTN